MGIALGEKQKKEGWTVVRFGQIAREVKKTTQDPAADGYEFYMGLDHLDPQSLRITRKGIIAEDNPTFTRCFSAGNILFGKRRSYQKKAAVADFDGICSGDIIVMEAIPKGPVIPELLPFIVQSDGFFDWAEKTSMGSLSPRTKWSALAEYEFRLPPVGRQREILEVLEKVEECGLSFVATITAIEKVQSLAIFDLFSHKVKLIEKLKDSASVLTGQNDAIDKSLSSGIKMITLPCVSKYCDFTIIDDEIAYVRRDSIEDSDYVRKGDILFNWRNGSQDHIGKIGFISQDMDYVHVGFLLRIKADSNKINAKYLYWYIRYLKQSGFFTGAKQQVNRTFNKGELLELDIARYSEESENRMVSILNSIESERNSILNAKSKYVTMTSRISNQLLTHAGIVD